MLKKLKSLRENYEDAILTITLLGLVIPLPAAAAIALFIDITFNN